MLEIFKEVILQITKSFWMFNRYISFLHRSVLFFASALSAIFFIGLSNNAYATHAAGSDLTYRWISGNIYEVTVNFYRDCQGVAAPTNVTLNVKSTSCGQNFNVTLNPIGGTGQEITFPCNPTSTYCGQEITFPILPLRAMGLAYEASWL